MGGAGEVDGEDRRDVGGPQVAGCSGSGTTRDHRILRGRVVEARQLDPEAGWILRL
ncbi:hypothetical protein PF003_g39059 [Phytophthora fragariae]|nr:hypothetical protein PF003_g39072 [Phytophthora fragariae]KAE8876830.1 hypothetical protein PF003_g39059 [Phytophthora fragariae]